MNLDVYDDSFAQRHGSIQKPIFFFLLCFFTVGLYAIWWQYKVWRFFKEKDDMDIYPAARAIFSVFFINSLLERIDYEAQAKGHPGIRANAYAWLYVITAIIARAIGRIPSPISGLMVFVPAYAFLLPSLKQLNYYWQEEAPHATPRTMGTGDIVVTVFGVVFFLLALLGVFVGEQQ